MTTFKDSKETPYEKITVALVASQVTRVGALVVHPSNEGTESKRWCVTAPCGMSLAKFGSREAAELFAGRAVELADWSTSPTDVPEASTWAQVHFIGDSKKALQAALTAACERDKALHIEEFA